MTAFFWFIFTAALIECRERGAGLIVGLRPAENDSRQGNNASSRDVPPRDDRAGAQSPAQSMGRRNRGANASRPDPDGENRRRAGGFAVPDPVQRFADVFPSAPKAWAGRPHGTIYIPPGGLWLRLNRDAELAYAECSGLEQTNVTGPYYSERSVTFRAGQLVRVVDGLLPDDGIGYVPTVRADHARVHISDSTAAEPAYIPPADGVARLCQRSRDEVGFWQAMIAAPEDDLPRMLYADWLDERGDPAGGILRGDGPLTLHGWTSMGRVWKRRNHMRVTWRQVLNQMRGLLAQSPHHHFQFQPGPSEPGVASFAGRPQTGPNGSTGEWHGLSVTTGSAEPVPHFVNYLLIYMTFVLCLPPEARDRGEKRLPGEGEIWAVGTSEYLIVAVHGDMVLAARPNEVSSTDPAASTTFAASVASLTKNGRFVRHNAAA
ncbi:MAG TPA: TIGR02996 domain-containing protein [Gemmataceae bacterium]|nr:TIGR02996 domain-containing protein [Gemmataceae bacterium]